MRATSTSSLMYGFENFSGNRSIDLPRLYSPVTFSQEWPKLSRLLFLLFCACFGSVMNGFFVAAFFVEHSLKRLGNVFLACVGLSDLIITGMVMPICAVVLLSGQWDNIVVCTVLQLFTEISTYCYSIFFTLVAAENYYRSCRSTREYGNFLNMRIGIVTIFIFVFSMSLAAVGIYFELDYDYCERQHFGNLHFRIITAVLFQIVPCNLTFYYLITASFRIRKRARLEVSYRRSRTYERDNSTTALNITAYALYVIAWIPYLIVVHKYPDTSDAKYYSTVWIGAIRSVITGFLYGITGRNFRRAFAHLFNYCCCKSNLSGPFVRHRRGLDYKKGPGEVRVHIMHQIINVNSPLRTALTVRETQDL